MRLKFLILLFLVTAENALHAQSQEFEKLRVLFRQHQVKAADTLLLEYHEIIWIELTVKDSTIISAIPSFSENSRIKKQIIDFLQTKVKGYKFEKPTFSKIIIPLMVGYFGNKTALIVKHEWELLESLKTKDLENKPKKDMAVVFPIFNVIGTYSPPHKIRKTTQ